jgi:hypothetical protein
MLSSSTSCAVRYEIARVPMTSPAGARSGTAATPRMPRRAATYWSSGS